MDKPAGLFQRVTDHDIWERQQSSDNYRDTFTYGAIKALHEWYVDMALDQGTVIEFDYIGMVCDWTEYTKGELIDAYSHLVTSRMEHVQDLIDEIGGIVLEAENLDSAGKWVTTYLVME